jgi:hypothetical protein
MRETTIDKVKFDGKAIMQKVVPTLESVGGQKIGIC